jgi:hypothetical protein
MVAHHTDPSWRDKCSFICINRRNTLLKMTVACENSQEPDGSIEDQRQFAGE